MTVIKHIMHIGNIWYMARRDLFFLFYNADKVGIYINSVQWSSLLMGQESVRVWTNFLCRALLTIVGLLVLFF